MRIEIGEVVFPVVGYISCRFIMGQAAGIEGFRPSERRFEGAAVGAFVAHGPDDDRRPVFVAFHAALYTVERCGREFRIIRYPLVPVKIDIRPAWVVADYGRSGAVAFVVGLADDVEAESVIQIVEVRRVRIMACSNRIDVMLLHERQIRHDLLLADGRTCHRVAVVSVDAMEFDGLAVDGQDTVFIAYFTYADMIGDGFMFGFDNQCVEIGRFRSPYMRVFYSELGMGLRAETTGGRGLDGVIEGLGYRIRDAFFGCGSTGYGVDGRGGVSNGIVVEYGFRLVAGRRCRRGYCPFQRI